MEVRYTLTIDDYVEFSLHWQWRSPWTRWLHILVMAIPIVVIWVTLGLKGRLQIAGIALGAVATVTYAVVSPHFYRGMVASRIYAQTRECESEFLGQITLILTEDTLTERVQSVESVARWEDMKGMEVVGDCTYIYVTALLTAIIPRHGFDWPEDYEAVKQFALAKLGKSKAR